MMSATSLGAFVQAECTTQMAFHTISVMARAWGVTTVIATSTYLKEAVCPPMM